jgi:hypothetical protein
MADYEHVDPRTDAEVARDNAAEAKARESQSKARKAPAPVKAAKAVEPKPVKSK